MSRVEKNIHILCIDGVSQELVQWLLPSSLIALAHLKREDIHASINDSYSRFLTPDVAISRNCMCQSICFNRCHAITINGINHGKAKHYNEKSASMSNLIETSYLDGRKNGIQKIWYVNGALHSETSYINDEKHGVYKEWSVSGRLILQTHFKHDMKNGVETEWYESGFRKQQTDFVDNQKHGTKINWYKSGNISTISHFENNLMHGIQKSWHENGNQASENYTYEGELQRTAKTWFSNGCISSEVEYQDGEKHGEAKYWRNIQSAYPILLRTSEFRFNRKDGFAIEFKDDGSVNDIQFYIKDQKKDPYIDASVDHRTRENFNQMTKLYSIIHSSNSSSNSSVYNK